jgi:hypothetical protein
MIILLIIFLHNTRLTFWWTTMTCSPDFYQRSLKTQINLLYSISPDRKHCFGILKKRINRFKVVYLKARDIWYKSADKFIRVFSDLCFYREYSKVIIISVFYFFQRLWVPGPKGDFFSDLKYLHGFTQIQDLIDRAIIRAMTSNNDFNNVKYTFSQSNTS